MKQASYRETLPPSTSVVQESLPSSAVMAEVESLEVTGRFYLPSLSGPLSIEHNLLSRNYCVYHFVQKKLSMGAVGSEPPRA